MKITGIPFIIGAWIPYWFDWWGGIDFPISATIIISILMITGTIKAA